MEERSNNNLIFIISFIAIFAIVGISTYRSEQAIRSFEEFTSVRQSADSSDIEDVTYTRPSDIDEKFRALTSAIKEIKRQTDSHQRAISALEDRISDSGSADSGNSSGNEYSNLSMQTAKLQKQVEQQQKAIDRLNKSVTLLQQSINAGNQKTSASNTAAPSSDKKATTGSRRVTVSAKVKVENRYVQGETYLPAITKGPVGRVVINLTINRLGMVGSVSVNGASTISDEEIIDLCKDAALRTNFAYNPEAPEKSTGTITYTFAE